jgi:hypothetical protein
MMTESKMSIASMAQDWTKQNKLKPFFKEDTPPLKRIKAVTSFYASASPQERIEFHNAHFTQVRESNLILTHLHCSFIRLFSTVSKNLTTRIPPKRKRFSWLM